MSQTPSCKFCKTKMSAKKFENRIWHTCTRCHSHYVPIDSFKKILSEPEFHKLNLEIRQAQLKSSDHCAICKKQMIKIIELLHENTVEVCSDCRLIWLDPGEGEKIKRDQEFILNSGKKIKLSDNGELDREICWRSEAENSYLASPLYRNRYDVFTGGLFWPFFFVLKKINIDTSKSEAFVKRNPFISFILLLIFLVFLIKLIKFWLAKGHIHLFRRGFRFFRHYW